MPTAQSRPISANMSCLRSGRYADLFPYPLPGRVVVQRPVPLPKIWTGMATTSRRISRSFTTACLLSGILHMHLLEIDQTARKRLELMMPEMAKAAGATKELKTYAQINFVKGILEKGKHEDTNIKCALVLLGIILFSPSVILNE